MPALNLNDLNNGKKDLDHIAEIATSTKPTAADRMGRTKFTVRGAIDSLKAFNVRGAFVAGTPYVTKDVYLSNGVAYVVLVDHVASTIAADLQAGKVTVHQGATREELAAPSGSSLIGFLQDGIGAVVRWILDKLRESVSPEDFGAVGDGIVNDSAAYQRAVTHCVKKKRKLYLPNKYRLDDPIDCAPDGIRTGLTMQGSGMAAGQITTSYDGILFKHCERLIVYDLQVIKLGGPGNSSQAFATPNNIQAARCAWRNVDAVGFMYGFIQRYSIWNTWDNVVTTNCTCGFRFVRNDDMYNQENPVATTIWNLFGGWFHNQNTFTNVTCEGGEVGVYGSLQGAVFDGITTQNQKASAGGNKVLPIGEPGTGIWLDAGKSSPTDLGWNNEINGFYSEGTERPLHFIDQRSVSVNTYFTQGGSNANPYPCILRANNSKVDISGGTTQDYFTNKVQLVNGAVVTGPVLGIVTVAANEAVVDATSKYLANGSEERFVQHYKINKPNASSGQVYTVPLNLVDFSVYEVDIIASENGGVQRRVSYRVSRYNGAYVAAVDTVSGVAGPWTVAPSGVNLNITFTDVLPVVAHVYVRKLTDIPSSAITLTPK